MASGGNLSKCQSPPPVTTLTRRTVTPDNPDPAEVITEVNIMIISIFSIFKSINIPTALICQMSFNLLALVYLG